MLQQWKTWPDRTTDTRHQASRSCCCTAAIAFTQQISKRALRHRELTEPLPRQITPSGRANVRAGTHSDIPEMYLNRSTRVREHEYSVTERTKQERYYHHKVFWSVAASGGIGYPMVTEPAI